MFNQQAFHSASRVHFKLNISSYIMEVFPTCGLFHIFSLDFMTRPMCMQIGCLSIQLYSLNFMFNYMEKTKKKEQILRPKVYYTAVQG